MKLPTKPTLYALAALTVIGFIGYRIYRGFVFINHVTNLSYKMRDIILTVFRLALFLVTPALYLLTVAVMVVIAFLSFMWFVQILESLCR